MAGYLFVHFTGEQKDGEQIYFFHQQGWTSLGGSE